MKFRFALTLSINKPRWSSVHFGDDRLWNRHVNHSIYRRYVKPQKCTIFIKHHFFYIPPKRIFLWTSTPYAQVIESHLFNKSEVKISSKAKIVELKKITSRIDSITKFGKKNCYSINHWRWKAKFQINNWNIY